MTQALTGRKVSSNCNGMISVSNGSISNVTAITVSPVPGIAGPATGPGSGLEADGSDTIDEEVHLR